ncbi:MAG: hypothetical protein LBR65_01865 [Culturomica sp.]|jgi:uncharacterized protein YfaS (alpha-2-macroglobulin family)|nr:hypothetical protein [Culturomica sp.]
MIQRGLLFTILLSVAGVLSAQENKKWERAIAEKPATVIRQADSLIQYGNDLDRIEGMILKARAEVTRDRSRYPEILKEFEERIRNNDHTIGKVFLCFAAAECYREYYDQNRRAIDQRVEIHSHLPENIAEWSRNLFLAKIREQLTEPLKLGDLLKKADARSYKKLLEENYPYALYPTLFDFACNESIAGLVYLENRQGDFSDAILSIYQRWLDFERTEWNIDAWVAVDLAKLQYERQVVRKKEGDRADSLYLERLLELRKTYNLHPAVVRVMYAEAIFYLNHRPTDNETYRKALELVQEGIKRFPQSDLIDKLKNIERDVERPRIDFQLPEIVYPGILSLKTTYYHLDEAGVILSKVTECSADYYNKKNHREAVRREIVSQQKFSLPKLLAVRDTTLMIPVDRSGLYSLSVAVPGMDPISLEFVCSPFLTTNLTRKGYIDVVVRDAISGASVAGADVRIFVNKDDYTSPYRQVAVFRTDSYGIASMPDTTSERFGSRNVKYEVTTKEHPQGKFNSMYVYPRSPERLDYQVLFTDRKIYRPGQTVYYKGIACFTDSQKSGVERNKKITVELYDANNDELSIQSVTTNEWGSFSGSFVLPAETKNGTFSFRTTGGYAYFRVEDYKLPGFEIFLDTVREGYRFNDTIRFTGKVKSYSGVPVQGGRVAYRITLRSGWWWDQYSEPMENGEVYTEPDGSFSVDFLAKPGRVMERAWGYYYDITIDASDAKGETQTISRQIPIGKEAYTVEVEMPEQIDKNKNEVIRIKAYNRNGIEIPETLQYTIAALPPLNNVKERYDTDTLPAGKILLRGTISTQSDTLPVDFSTWESGAYVLRVENGTETENPHEKVTQRLFYLYADTDTRPPLTTYHWFVPVRTSFREGESAELLFGTSVREACVLYEFFDSRSALIKREQLTLSGEVRKFSIPYRPEYGNRITVFLSFVKDNQLFTDRTTIHREQEEKHLTIRTKVFRDKLRPGEQETWEFTVTDASGKPVAAEIMAALYDRSLDRLSSNNWSFLPQEWGRNVPDWSTVYPGLRTARGQFPLYFRYPELTSFRYFETYSAFSGEVYFIESLTGAMRIPKYVTSEVRLTGAADNSSVQPVVPLRKNFHETAFFYPDLYSNREGEFSLRFTMPEAVTGWKLMMLAHTQDLKVGNLLKEITTSKEMTVAPNVPRFFRSGDQAVLKTNINNLSDTSLSGEAVLELFDPATEEVLFRKTVPFAAGWGENTTATFAFTVPGKITVIGCRVSAATASFSDGEQHLVAVVPDQVLLTQALPLFTESKGTTTYTLKPSAEQRQDYRLTAEVTSNPVWYAVLAIPSLQDPGTTENAIALSAAFYANAVNNAIIHANPQIGAALQVWKSQSPKGADPLEDDELKSILLELTPWAGQAGKPAGQIPALQQFFNQNTLLQRQKQIAEKLIRAQNSDGSWSWFKGFSASPFITCNILTSAARAAVGGDEMITGDVRAMRMNGIRYLDKMIQEQYDEGKKKGRSPAVGYQTLLYLHTRSFYRDLPLADALEAHKAYMEHLKTDWIAYSVYKKGLAATTLFRYGYKEEALRVLNSLKEYATLSPEEGMFWPNNTSSVYSVNSAILTHVAILEAFYEITPDDAAIGRMKIWLLKQKQTQDWADVPSTVDAIYALLLTGDDLLSQQEDAVVKLGNNELKSKPDAPFTGYLKESWEAGEIRPDMLTMELTKQTGAPTWGALYLQYFAPLKNLASGEHSHIRVEKSLYVEQQADGKNRITPVTSPLSTGEKVVVRLKIEVDRDMEYVHLKDLRAACLEPVEQLSGMQWKGGLTYYRETKNSSTNFFFNYLPKGSYIIEYALWVNQSGTYQDGVATIQCLYAPAFTAHSRSTTLQVK